MLSTVLLSIKGDLRQTKVPLHEGSTLTMECLQKFFKKKESPEFIDQYEYEDKWFHLFGFKKGKKGTENKNEFTSGLFGDALVIASLSPSWEHPIPLTVEKWAAFLEEQAEEDEEEEDEDEEEEEEEEEAEEAEVEDAEDALEDAEDVIEDVEEEAEAEEVEEIVRPIPKRRRAATKIDAAALKEKIPYDSEPETYPTREKALTALGFLREWFDDAEIRTLERAIFEATYQAAEAQFIAQNWKTPLFCEIYRQRLHTVVCNLHPRSPVQNTRLLGRIKDGEFTLDELPFMTAYEMFPEKWFALKDKLLQREQKILEGNKSRATDQFKCRRCHKRECTYYELQTRSADEPMTIFIMCLNCGKEWRQGG